MKKNYYLNPPQQPDVSFMDTLIAEMVIDKALLHFQREQILKEIDEALAEHNKEKFLKLTEELKKLS
jgi:uncharacterized protein YpiB (UPF0302 family)